MNWFKMLFIKQEKRRDLGIRGTFEGALYIDKKVFFARPEVRKLIKGLMDNKNLRREITNNNRTAL